MKRARDEWLCGYAAALADLNRCFHHEGMVASTMQSGGITIERLRKGGVEAYDLDELKRCVQPRRRRSR